MTSLPRVCNVMKDLCVRISSDVTGALLKYLSSEMNTVYARMPGVFVLYP